MSWVSDPHIPFWITPSLCWLFMISLALDMFIRLSFLSEWVDCSHTLWRSEWVGCSHTLWRSAESDLPPNGCPWIEPVTLACQIHEGVFKCWSHSCHGASHHFMTAACPWCSFLMLKPVTSLSDSGLSSMFFHLPSAKRLLMYTTFVQVPQVCCPVLRRLDLIHSPSTRGSTILVHICTYSLPWMEPRLPKPEANMQSPRLLCSSVILSVELLGQLAGGPVGWWACGLDTGLSQLELSVLDRKKVWVTEQTDQHAWPPRCGFQCGHGLTQPHKMGILDILEGIKVMLTKWPLL